MDDYKIEVIITKIKQIIKQNDDKKVNANFIKNSIKLKKLIDRRKQMEEKLAKSEETFSKLSEQIFLLEDKLDDVITNNF